MSIEFPCPHCHKKYRVDNDKAGKKFRCKKCEKAIQVPDNPMAEDVEYSTGGSQVLRHKERSIPFEMAIGDSENIEAISEHIAEHIGPVDSVFHEIISDLVHIDVHVVKPDADHGSSGEARQ